MAVEVIGKDERQFKETSCSRCANRLRYTSADVFIHQYSACGSMESDRAIRCTCGHIVFVR